MRDHTTGNHPTQAHWNWDTSYLRLPTSCYSRVAPVPVPAPELILLNDSLALNLGLRPHALRAPSSIAVLAGNAAPAGSETLAQAYAGHQYGHFTQLGDGRAHLLGEHITPDGKRFDIQLKGSGRTPYSRRGDGRAALGPMLREYIISEAMHALGIPTTRSLAVITTGEQVFRTTVQPGAILTRVAASHIRVGTFEWLAASSDAEALSALVHYTLQRHFPTLDPASDPALTLLQAAVPLQAELVARWLLVGFVHGVMNTDNMAVCGETIDYGPCAFIDHYDPNAVFSSIDHHGRYAYAQQPGIAQWNLARLAEALLPAMSGPESVRLERAEEAVHSFSDHFKRAYHSGLCAKLGLQLRSNEDVALANDLLHWMRTHAADFTNTWHALDPELPTPAQDLPGVPTADRTFTLWHDRWLHRWQQEHRHAEQVLTVMQRHNPRYIPRNHLVEEALQAAVEDNDLNPLQQLNQILATPYLQKPDTTRYQSPPPPGQRVYQTFCGT